MQHNTCHNKRELSPENVGPELELSGVLCWLQHLLAVLCNSVVYQFYIFKKESNDSPEYIVLLGELSETSHKQCLCLAYINFSKILYRLLRRR